MTPTKLLIGQVLIVFAIMVLGPWAATQWAAAMLAYQRELGPAWFSVGGLPLYRPWALFGWWFYYEAYAPAVFNRAGALAGASGFLGCGAAIAGSLWRARQSSNVTTYGSARWATEAEVREAGLLGGAGVFLGSLAGSDLRHDGPEHVLAFAPTRSGKGVGLVVPTLLSWTGSAVIHDIKGENWELTAGWRSRFSHCLLFNPTDPRSARYNPLLEVRPGPHEVRDVQNIADILVDPEGALERRNHWEKTSHSLLVGAILHISTVPSMTTPSFTERPMARPNRSMSSFRRCSRASSQVTGRSPAGARKNLRDDSPLPRRHSAPGTERASYKIWCGRLTKMLFRPIADISRKAILGRVSHRISLQKRRAMKRLVLAALLLATTSFAQAAGDPTGFASAADVKAQVESMRRAMKPGQGFMWKPLVRGSDAVAALEYWKKPGKPAVHPNEAEYVIVIAGNGTMVSGGRLLDPVTTNPTLTEGSRIEGGTTRPLHPGDVFLIPAGMPHWFGISGDRLVLLGTKITQPSH